MQIVLTLLSGIAAVVPMVAYLVAIWVLDRHDREPIWLVLLTFLWGAVGAVLIALVGNTALDMLLTPVAAQLATVFGYDPSMVASMVGPTIVAPIVEEPAKAVFLLFVLWNRRLQSPSDGFIYGAAAGLGFGMTENLLYFTSVTGDVMGWSMVVVIRTLYSAVLHATCTSLVGAALSLARFRHPVVGSSIVAVGFGFALLIHGMWNGFLSIDAFVPNIDLATLNFVLLPAEIVTALALWQATLYAEGWLLFRELREESDQGTLPRAHAQIIASWWRRLLPGRLPESMNRAVYVRAATSLAIRRDQLKRMGPMADSFYRDDAARLRKLLLRLQGSDASKSIV